MLVQDCVVSTHTPMWTTQVIMVQPDANDVIELSSAEANEEVQCFLARGGDKPLNKRIHFGGLGRNPNASHVWFPKRVEFVGTLSVVVPDEEPCLDALVLHPH